MKLSTAQFSLMTISIIVFSLFLVTPVLALNPCLSDLQTISSESNSYAYRAIIDVDANDTIHIAWKDKSNYNNSGSDWDVFYKQKTKNGEWSKTEVVSFDSKNDCNCLFLDVDQMGNVYIVWKEQVPVTESQSISHIFFSMKKVNEKWSEKLKISTESNGTCSCPCLNIDRYGTLHVTWSDNSNILHSNNDFDVFYKQKPKNKNWSNTAVITSNSTMDSYRPFLDVDTLGSVHLVWEEKATDYGSASEHWNVFYKQKPILGTWTENVLISNVSDQDANRPIVRVDHFGIVHLIWIDHSNLLSSGFDSDVFYKQKDLQGIWTPLELISMESKTSVVWPCLFVDDEGNAHISWTDSTDYFDNGLDSDVFYKLRSFNDSVNPTELISIESNNDSSWTWLTVDSSDIVHFSWWDDNGKWITFYRNKSCIYSPHDEIPDKIISKDTSWFSIGYFILTLLIFLYFNKKE